MLKEGNLQLHKIASNNKDVLNPFPEEDLDKSLRTLDLTPDILPVQRSLGLGWDCFVFSVTNEKKRAHPQKEV